MESAQHPFASADHEASSIPRLAKKLRTNDRLKREDEQAAGAASVLADPFRRLPDEVFDFICEYASDFGEDLKTSFAMSQVSRHWRALVIGNPRLWRCVKAVFPRDLQGKGRQRIDTVLERFKACTISVVMKNVERQLQEDDILGSLFEVDAARRLLHSLFPLAHTLDVDALAMPTSLELSQMGSLSRVRTLALVDVVFDSPSHLLDLLASCSRIMDLTLSDIMVVRQSPIDRVVALPDLETLTFDYTREDMADWLEFGLLSWWDFLTHVDARLKDVCLMDDLADFNGFDPAEGLWPMEVLSEVRRLTLKGTSSKPCGKFIFALISSQSALEYVFLRDLNLSAQVSSTNNTALLAVADSESTAIVSASRPAWSIPSHFRRLSMEDCKGFGWHGLEGFLALARWRGAENGQSASEQDIVISFDDTQVAEEFAGRLKQHHPKVFTCL